ncbi:MAG: hypothetical protein GY820_39490 [Gammaproteobacteria bacterium]|nr:hypothetical protein [Gammaproteobacteria bacterium]
MIRGTVLKSGLSFGNGKLSRRIGSFSLPRVTTCPGMSEWCKLFCYMAKLEIAYASMLASYHANVENSTVHPREWSDAMVRDIERKRVLDAVRIHVDGDFHSAPYVRAWIAIIRACPDVRFYAYTRSWAVKRLRKSLEELRSLPNMTLFASMDPTMENPPAGWRVAWIEGDPRAKGPICPEQQGRKANCAECGICFRSGARNIRFQTH